MGQGRPNGRTVHCPGAAGNGRVGRDRDVLESYELKKRGRVLVRGRSVGSKIAAGPVHVIKSAQYLGEFKEGEVLVTDKTDPDWEPIMKKAAAIVTNRGGRTCHAAIVSRELGVPAIVGTEHGTEMLVMGKPSPSPARKATSVSFTKANCRSKWSARTSKTCRGRAPK